MINSSDQKVTAFLNDIRLLSEEKSAILQQCRWLIFAIHPRIRERMMYGGIMFSLQEDVAGIFAHKNHVSMEFDSGHLMSDPDKILQGSGKFRRHIKFTTIEQIEQKRLQFFLQQLG